MEILTHLGGYLASVLAAAGIVVGIEALNEGWLDALGRGPRPLAIPVAHRRVAPVDELRRSGS
jgi:hypothetical protein